MIHSRNYLGWLMLVGLLNLIWPNLNCNAQEQKPTMEQLYELASERMIDRDIIDDAINLESDFGQHGSAGYRAVCLLIEHGYSKGTPMLPLLEATWTSGDEQDLLELCKKPELPGFGHWIALQGLGFADTLEVREYLSERIETERDPGKFYSIAMALANLDEVGPIEVIGEQLLKFDEGWEGVEQHLLGALTLMDAEHSLPWIERYVLDPSAGQYMGPLKFIQDRDPERSKRLATEVLATRTDLNAQQKWWLELYRDYQIPTDKR